MFSYTPGFSFQAQRDIYPSDLDEMCQYLQQDPFYQGEYEFSFDPQRGIQVKYQSNLYKSINWNSTMASWNIGKPSNTPSPIIYKNRYIFTFLRCLDVNDLFTSRELQIWNSHFEKIGLLET